MKYCSVSFRRMSSYNPSSIFFVASSMFLLISFVVIYVVIGSTTPYVYNCGFDNDISCNTNKYLMNEYNYFHIKKGCTTQNSTLLDFPSTCKALSFCEARKCLKTVDLIFLGDSVTGQIIYSWSNCKSDLCFGDNKWKRLPDVNDNYFHLITMENKFLDIRVIQLNLVRDKNITLTHGINKAFDLGLLKQNLTWIINFGLHYMLCDYTNNFNNLCVDPKYHQYVRDVLTIITQRAPHGVFYWRQTTSVNPSNIPATVPNEIKHKFGNFTNVAVHNLNMISKAVVEEFDGLVKIIDVYEASRNADYFIPDDSRHFNGLGLKMLHQVHYNAWCNGVNVTSASEL